MMLSGVNDALVHQVKWFVFIFAGLAALVVLLAAVGSPSEQTWIISGPKVSTSGLESVEDSSEGSRAESEQLSSPTGDAEKNWNTWTTRATEWEIRNTAQQEQHKEDPNWAGRQKMRKQRAEGAFWWDERAAQYFTSKLEASQFPANCSQVHWVAHYDFVAGLMSSVHMFLLPMFFSMLRGQTFVVISEPHRHPAFDGCGPDVADRNMQCYFNVTDCNPGDDPSRLSEILARHRDRERTSWEELLMEEEDFFPRGGVTVIQTFKQPFWSTKVCVGTSAFSSLLQAYHYHKLSLWNTMGQHGKTGVVARDRKKHMCSLTEEKFKTSGRADMVMTSLMSSWMLNQMHENVKLAADQIMSRYTDPSGKPLWQPPVLAMHVRQTDKTGEDPYFVEHGIYRPIEDYALHMRRMEEQYGFQWPSVFIISDSGTARETLVGVMNSTTPPGNSTSRGQDNKYIMYDWIEDDHLVEKFKDHMHVPKPLKHDMQVHFLATLYIAQKIADHAIVTYSSNVGRFIGEIMAAKHKMAFVDTDGPLVTSLDFRWYWLE